MNREIDANDINNGVLRISRVGVRGWQQEVNFVDVVIRRLAQ